MNEISNQDRDNFLNIIDLIVSKSTARRNLDLRKKDKDELIELSKMLIEKLNQAFRLIDFLQEQIDEIKK